MSLRTGVDFDDSFSPTPGLAVGRFMLLLAVAIDYELHAYDIEQAFLLADKLPEGVNGRYFIQPPPAAPTLITEMLCTRFAVLFMVTPLHHALCTRPWTPIL